MKTEIFKNIEGYEGLYKVSNLGNIKSLKYGKERLLKPTKDGKGYLRVILYKNGKPKKYLVHRLVATSFLPNPNNLPCVNHKDENPSNNRIENLELCTYSYNNSYGTRNQKMLETRAKKSSVKAEKSIIQYTKDMIEVGRFKSAYEASRKTGINQANIGSCCRGKLKSAGNFVWRYI